MLAIILLVLCIWLWPAGPAADQLPNAPPAAAPGAGAEMRFPYYGLPASVSLCGEEVPLKERDVRESLDREFMLTVWSRAQTTMWLNGRTAIFLNWSRSSRPKAAPWT